MRMTEFCLQPDLVLPRPPALSNDTALMMDFDGTLAAIAGRPDAVIVAPYLPQLLWRTRGALLGALAIVTGRTIMEIDKYTKSTVITVAGVHGLELRSSEGTLRFSRSIHLLLPDLAARLTALGRRWLGVIIEDKGAAVALHYRQCPAAEEDCKALACDAAASTGGECEVIEGKLVVELKRRSHDKGTAVREIMSQTPFMGRRPIFVGDDRTDEAAFSAVLEMGGCAVLVGQRWPTAATCALKSVNDVHDWIGHVTYVRRSTPQSVGEK